MMTASAVVVSQVMSNPVAVSVTEQAEGGLDVGDVVQSMGVSVVFPTLCLIW